REVTVDGRFLARLETGRDWRAEIERLADEADVDAGWFVGVGAVSDAEIWYYDQTDGEYHAVELDEPLEVAACLGNVSLLPAPEESTEDATYGSESGDRFAHTHAVLSRRSGGTLAGHLNAGTVFVGEIYLTAFERPLEREYDPALDLELWL
ncbi:MAG: PPC domain-containing DNA-binding protein, partial [Halanaeroarchaeum sp.]